MLKNMKILTKLANGKVGIILGWQNTSAIENDLKKLKFFMI